MRVTSLHLLENKWEEGEEFLRLRCTPGMPVEMINRVIEYLVDLREVAVAREKVVGGHAPAVGPPEAAVPCGGWDQLDTDASPTPEDVATSIKAAADLGASSDLVV